MLFNRLAVSDTNTNEVIEITIRQPLDIQINRCSFNLQFRTTDDMDFLFPNRERLQRMMVLLPLIVQSLWSSPGPESVGKLSDCKDAFTVEFPALLFRHPRQQTEIVLFNRFLPTPELVFTLCTVPVQNEIGRRITRHQCCYLCSQFP